MNLNLQALCECLPDNLTYTKFIKNNNQLFSFPKLINKSKIIENNSLYIGHYKEFPDLAFKNNTIAIICIGNIPNSHRIDCSLLQMNENINIIEVYSSIVEIYHKYNTWEKELLEMISSNADLKQIIDFCKPLFEGNQLNCISLNGEILAGTINSSLVNFNTHNTHIPLPMLAQNIDTIKPFLAKGVSQYATSQINDLKFNYVQRSIYSDNQQIGLVNCTDTSHPLKEIEILLLNKLCDIIEKSLTEGWLLEGNHRTKINSYLKSILTGDSLKLQKFASYLNEKKLLNDCCYLCLCLRIKDVGSSTFLSDFFSVHFHHYFPDSFLCVIDSNIIILFCSSNNNVHNDNIDLLNKYLSGCQYQIGISNPFYSIEDIIHYYHQALIAIDSKHELSSTINICYFNNAVLSYIFNQATSSLPKIHICHPGIMDLYKYDKLHGSSYINTLKCYFENKQNAIKTADALYIHRTTLLYRLDRIKNIIGDNWNTYRKLLYIMISLQMLDES